MDWARASSNKGITTALSFGFTSSIRLRQACTTSTEETSDPAVSEFKGLAASRGSYAGTARVVMGEEQFDRIQPGDVLVCPITTPAWNVVLSRVGAIVADHGGILSHPAIIAREFGIPAVVGTLTTTTAIPDGSQLEVDGTAGVVRVVG